MCVLAKDLEAVCPLKSITPEGAQVDVEFIASLDKTDLDYERYYAGVETHAK